MVSHPDIECIAGNKQHIVYLNSEANRCIEIYLLSSLVPVLSHIPSKNVRLMTLLYKDNTASSVFNETMMPCSDKYYHKGTCYTQTFLCYLLSGWNKNQFFHYFSLLQDLLHRQDLPKKWFERRIKRLTTFLSIFRKGISQVAFIILIPKATSI